jgi:hypothetical protein
MSGETYFAGYLYVLIRRSPMAQILKGQIVALFAFDIAEILFAVFR